MKSFQEGSVISLEVRVIVQVGEINTMSEILGEDVLRVMFCVLVDEEESQLAMRRVGSAYRWAALSVQISQLSASRKGGNISPNQSARSERTEFWVSSRLSISYRRLLSVSPLVVAQTQISMFMTHGTGTCFIFHLVYAVSMLKSECSDSGTSGAVMK